MNIETKLTKELQKSCTGVLQNNFDGEMEVRQVGKGPILRFTFIDDDGEYSSSLTAHFVGSIRGHDIYSFCRPGNTPQTGVHMTLVPTIIVGLMTL